MHTLLDHDGHIPVFVTVTEARTHESHRTRILERPTGSIVVFNKGYICCSWFGLLHEKSVFVITRLKQNASYRLLARRAVNRRTGVTSDHIIEVTRKGKNLRLRRIDHWQIEIFFREIKRNLRIKSFISNTENTLPIQIYTILRVYLLLAHKKFLIRVDLSIQHLFQIIQFNLLGCASLEELLNPARRKTGDFYSIRMLALILQPDSKVIKGTVE